MVVKICTHSSHIREYFCDHGILEKIIGMDEPAISMISILCAYTKASYFRWHYPFVLRNIPLRVWL